jgi:hypothetical protein
MKTKLFKKYFYISLLLTLSIGQHASAGICERVLDAIFNRPSLIEVADDIVIEKNILMVGFTPLLKVNKIIDHPDKRFGIIWPNPEGEGVHGTTEIRITRLEGVNPETGEAETYFRKQAFWIATLGAKKIPYAISAKNLAKFKMAMWINGEVDSTIWQFVNDNQVWAEQYRIYSDAFNLLIPNPETLNKALDQVAKEPAQADFQVGPRFETVNGSNSFMGRDRYTAQNFFDAILKGRVLIGTREFAPHDIFAEHLLGGLLVSTRVFDYLKGEAEFIEAVSMDSELAAFWQKGDAKMPRPYGGRLGGLKNVFAELWDDFTSEIARYVHGSSPGVGVKLGGGSPWWTLLKISPESTGINYQTWQHIPHVKSNIIAAINDANLDLASDKKLKSRLQVLSDKYQKAAFTEEDIKNEVRRIIRILELQQVK